MQKRLVSIALGIVILFTLIFATGSLTAGGSSFLYKHIYETLSLRQPFLVTAAPFIILFGIVCILALIWKGSSIVHSRTQLGAVVFAACVLLIVTIFTVYFFAEQQSRAGLNQISVMPDQVNSINSYMVKARIKAVAFSSPATGSGLYFSRDISPVSMSRILNSAFEDSSLAR